MPLDFEVDLTEGTSVRIDAQLERWFAPEEGGWFAGDNHVHAQHDATAAVKTSLAYTALQARANGLSFLTEAGSNVSYSEKDRLDTPTFLFRYAPRFGRDRSSATSTRRAFAIRFQPSATLRL